VLLPNTVGLARRATSGLRVVGMSRGGTPWAATSLPDVRRLPCNALDTPVERQSSGMDTHGDKRLEGADAWLQYLRLNPWPLPSFRQRGGIEGWRNQQLCR
jgi:hypothetical protein